MDGAVKQGVLSQLKLRFREGIAWTMTAGAGAAALFVKPGPFPTLQLMTIAAVWTAVYAFIVAHSN